MGAKRFIKPSVLLLLLNFILCTLFSTSASAESKPSFSIGAYGGIVVPTYSWDNAYSGDPHFRDEPADSWSEAGTFGISALYRLKNGWGLEIFAEKMIMSIEDDAGKWGEMDIAPIFFLVKYQSLPPSETGYAYHCGGGLGFASPDFTATRAGTSGWNFETDSSSLLEGDMGLDYFFSKRLSIAFDFRLIFSDFDSFYTINGEPAEEPNLTFGFNNFQFLVGVKAWF